MVPSRDDQMPWCPVCLAVFWLLNETAVWEWVSERAKVFCACGCVVWLVLCLPPMPFAGDETRQRVKFTDERVCKSHLLNCCPHDILSGTVSIRISFGKSDNFCWSTYLRTWLIYGYIYTFTYTQSLGFRKKKGKASYLRVLHGCNRDICTRFAAVGFENMSIWIRTNQNLPWID